MPGTGTDHDWPPRDASAFFGGEAFGKSLLGIVERLAADYPRMDFSDALAIVFVWLQRRAEVDRAFVSEPGRFKSESDLMAYLRQALWNAARSSERRRRARQEIEAPAITEELVSREISAETLAAFHECRDRLPGPLRAVFEMMHEEDDPPQGLGRDEWAARNLGCSLRTVQRRFRGACEQLSECMGLSPSPTSRARGRA